jgi:hypothetical protein
VVAVAGGAIALSKGCDTDADPGPVVGCSVAAPIALAGLSFLFGTAIAVAAADQPAKPIDREEVDRELPAIAEQRRLDNAATQAAAAAEAGNCARVRQIADAVAALKLSTVRGHAAQQQFTADPSYSTCFGVGAATADASSTPPDAAQLETLRSDARRAIEQQRAEAARQESDRARADAEAARAEAEAAAEQQREWDKAHRLPDVATDVTTLGLATQARRMAVDKDCAAMRTVLRQIEARDARYYKALVAGRALSDCR